MPAPNQTERLNEALTLVTTLNARLDSMNAVIESVTTAHSETTKTVGDSKTTIAVVKQQIDELNRWKGELGPELKTEIAILKRDVEELRKAKDEWGRRLWALVSPLVGAIVGAILTYFLKK